MRLQAQEARFSQLSHALWDGCSAAPHSYGKGLVSCGDKARDTLAHLNLAPDFDDPSGKLDYIHRADATTDIYFVRNATKQAVGVDVLFRVTGRASELWNAIDGSVTPAQSFNPHGSSTSVTLHLAPYGSTFVVFARTVGTHAPPGLAPRAAASSLIDLPAGQWTITFQPNRGAPSGTQQLSSVLPGFNSWTESRVPGVRYFSGTANYSTAVNLPSAAGRKYMLTLTDLREICTVRVNGKSLGTLWAMPYQLDITAALHAGRNTLELDVTNLWPNRIIGDAQPGATESFTHTNIRKYTAASPLLPSGLIGAVGIQSSTPVQR